MPYPKRVWRAAAVASSAWLLLLPACSHGRQPAEFPDLHGVRLTVLGDWSGAEQQRFERVLAGFTNRSGARLRYIPAHGAVSVALDARLAAHRPPDVALLPQPGLLRRYAAAGKLVPLSDATVRLVRGEYARTWLELASSGGRMYGVWFKAADKSLLWYDVDAFEKIGIAPPQTLAELEQTVRVLRGAGIAPFSLGAHDRWILTDWFENLYLQLAGARHYDLLAAHRIPWTDPSVVQALRAMARLLAPGNLAGGLVGSYRAGFEESVRRAFGGGTSAAMVMEGDFVEGVITSRSSARIGIDVDAVPFPSARPNVPAVVGGGDVAVQLRGSPGSAALMRYLATPAAAAVWARAGGFVSANQQLDLAVYRNPLQRSIARALVETGNAVRFDLSDLQPDAFGSTSGAGLQQALADFLRHRDPVATARTLERMATDAYARSPR